METEEEMLETVYEEIDSDIDENTKSWIIFETYNSLPIKCQTT